MTQEKMNLLVPQKLDALEKRYDIRVLLAVESGSRACRWALEQKSPPPVLFSRLAEAELPGSLGPAVEHLLLNQFLLAELQF